ncbi:hypothetical protein [Paracoccus sp. TOH]|uniref:hypothetical protein n=1 Tax=Paracoccus sp. TOH TaxID=1263728 RepID=UPI0025AF9FAD|nr:hypothetical protein [Paracoccus sp. TOH]WJS85321.1 hypothetical protein NBE95_14135 [Paracoccus sp. TOH]
MDRVLTHAAFDLPADCIGDLVVASTAGKALGTAEEEHDLTLRFHGGLDQQVLAFIVNGAMNETGDRDKLHNCDAWITAVAAG